MDEPVEPVVAKKAPAKKAPAKRVAKKATRKAPAKKATAAKKAPAKKAADPTMVKISPLAPEMKHRIAELADPKIAQLAKRGGVVAQNRARHDDKEMAKIQVLNDIRHGVTIEQAMKNANRTRKAFYFWVNDSPRYAAQVQQARDAYAREYTRSQMTFREQADSFAPILREDYPTWAAYVVAFRKAYFGFDTFDHQWQILDAWDASPPGGITVILTPPESGKTTLLADTVVADLCANPNMRRALVGEGQDKASKLMGRIQRRLSDEASRESALYAHFGPFQPPSSDRNRKWNSTEFTILASSHDEQDPSVTSVGMGSNIRGARWDAVDLDDIQSLKTEGRTKWMLDIFRGDIVTRPGKSGRIRVTGSRVARGDFYEELERLGLIDEMVVIPALDKTKPVGQQSYFPPVYDERGVRKATEGGEPLGWTDAELAQRESKVGPDMWSRIYMMKPQSAYSSMVNEADIANATDLGRIVGAPAPTSVGTIASLDPSLAAHAAFAYCGYDSDHLYVMDVKDMMRPGTNQALHAEIRAGTKRYYPDYWVIENNTLQRGYLTDDAFLALRDEYGFRAVGHHTGEQKTDAQLGVPNMMDAIVSGVIRFPRISGEHESFAMLFDQLMSWRPDVPTRRLTQDLVMALWFAYLRWRQLRQLVDVDTSGWKRTGLEHITMYPHARTNIAMPSVHERVKTPMTYEQQWDVLRAQQA